jgi:hypothetical protein
MLNLSKCPHHGNVFLFGISGTIMFALANGKTISYSLSGRKDRPLFYIHFLCVNVDIQPLRVLMNSMVSSMPSKHPTLDVNKVDITHIDNSHYYRNPAVAKLMGIPWKSLYFCLFGAACGIIMQVLGNGHFYLS